MALRSALNVTKCGSTHNESPNAISPAPCSGAVESALALGTKGKMNYKARKALRLAILDQINDDMLPLTVGGHTITDHYVYAGCSLWFNEDRRWDSIRHDYAYIVDGQYQLTFPDLSFFDGHNQLGRTTKFYLQPDRAETPPPGPIGDPLLEVPGRVLLDIAGGLAEAIRAHQAEQAAEDLRAIELTGVLRKEGNAAIQVS